MQNALAFRDVTFTPVVQNNTIYLTSSELAKALGYVNDRSVSKLFISNQDEFTPTMTIKPITDSVNGKQSPRLFSLRGSHLIAMFARTSVAKEFRKWVLDVLDKEVSKPQKQIGSGLKTAITEAVKSAIPHQMKPVTWTKPDDFVGPEFVKRGVPRDDKAIKKIIAELTAWGRENLPRGEVSNSFDEAMQDIERLQVTCWTHIDEALGSFSRGMYMLHRWQARGGRIGNVG